MSTFADIVRMAAAGERLGRIAETVGLSKYKLYEMLKRRGTTCYAIRRAAVTRAVLSLQGPRLTVADRARAAGVNMRTARSVLAEHGIDPECNRRWTEAEEEALRRNYPLHGPNVSKWDAPIDRSASAVRAHAMSVGIRRSR